MREERAEDLTFWMPTEAGVYSVKFDTERQLYRGQLEEAELGSFDAVGEAAAALSKHFEATGASLDLAKRMADIEFWERIPATERLMT